MNDDTKALGLIRRALAPLLREELIKALADSVRAELAPELEKVLGGFEEALAKRDTHISYEPNISVELPGLAKAADALTAPAISDYRPHDQDSGDIYSYYGFMHQSGSWYIMRSSSTDQRYASGGGKYEAAWKERAKQSYGLIDEAFNG